MASSHDGSRNGSRFGCNDGLSLAGRMSDRRVRRRARIPRVVQVAHESEVAYARCRDFSDTGMKLDLTKPLEINDFVSVALSNEISLHGVIAWVNGRECGVVFEEPVDSEALLAAAEPRRELRDGPSTLDQLGINPWAQHQPAPAELPSPRPGVLFQPGLAVTVMVGPDHEQRGTVRWARGNIAALEVALADRGDDRLLPAPNAR